MIKSWEEAKKVDDKIEKMKKKPLPFSCIVLEHPEEITNKFSGEKIMLEPDAVAVYDSIKGAEYLAQGIDDGGHPLWVKVRQGLDWFREHYPKEYMVLFD